VETKRDEETFYLDEAKKTELPRTNERRMSVAVRHSATLGKLAEALCGAQMKFDPLYKESENPAFRSKYADLATVIAATRPALAQANLALMQMSTTHGKDLTLTTLMAHSSGEWIANDLTMPATMRERFDAQSVGSAMTYARRYAWQGITGVAADVDDDGNDAVGIGSKEAAQAVGKAKVQEFQKKIAAQQAEKQVSPEACASLFYVWYDESQTAVIRGDGGLMKKNEDILKPLKLGGKLVANGEQLEALKFTLGERGVPFRSLQPTEEGA